MQQIKRDLLLSEANFKDLYLHLKELKDNQEIPEKEQVYIWYERTKMSDYLLSVCSTSYSWRWDLNNWENDVNVICDKVGLKDLESHIRPYVDHYE